MKIIRAIPTDKKAQLERLLSKGTVMIFVNARQGGVCVPPQHMGNLQLPLNLDYAYQIPDFKILNTRIEISLSFNKKDFFCVLPFDSVYAMTSQFTSEIVVFPESVPKEFLLPMTEASPPAQVSEKEKPEKPKRKPHLSVVPTPKGKKPSKKKKKKSPAKKKQKPHLKLVN